MEVDSHSHQSIARALKRLPIDLETLPEIESMNPNANVAHEDKASARRFNGEPPSGFGDLSPYTPSQFAALPRQQRAALESFRRANPLVQQIDADLAASRDSFDEDDALVLLVAVRKVLAERAVGTGTLPKHWEDLFFGMDDCIGDMAGFLAREREGRAR